MTIFINQLMLDKLGHEIREIRVRTLHDIEEKLKRAVLEHVDVEFNPPALFKNLIRWFGLDPICEEVVVLELMALLLASEFAAEIVNFFSAERIVKELKKIQVLIGPSTDNGELITFIIEQVGDADMEIKIIDSKVVEGNSEPKVEVELAQLATIRQSLVACVEKRWSDKDTLYTTFWEKQPDAVCERLDSLNDSLLNFEDEPNFKLALSYVIPYTKDYPAECFLRPPYICLSLLRMIRLHQVSIRAGFEMLLHLVESLQKRVRQRATAALYVPPNGIDLNEKTQLSVAAFAYETFLLGIQLLKELPTHLDLMSSNMILQVFDRFISFTLGRSCSLLENLPPPRFVEVRNELGYLLKHFRQEWESNSKNANSRTRYRMVLYITMNMIGHWKSMHDNPVDAPSPIKRGSRKETAGAYSESLFATLNSTEHQRFLEELDDTWMQEMHLALLDYPLKKANHGAYQVLLVLAAGTKEDMQKIRALAEIPDLLEPVVELLRAGPGAMDMTADELLVIGPDAIKTLFLHRSFGLMRMIMNTVSKCASSITEDVPLWDTIESITVRLLAERDEEIRCEAYVLCKDLMKEFIGQLDDGAILARRNLSSGVTHQLRSVGIPLTLRIVTEIVCFGYTSSNSKIRECAETMLMFLCNLKLFMPEGWSSVKDILLPIAPLLQTAAVGCADTKLRKAIMGMLHPDFELPWLATLQGNLLLLFHEDGAIRGEALTRVLFLLGTGRDQSEPQLVPRIEHIGDTVPSDLCLVMLPYDIRRQQQLGSVYEVSSVRPLLDMLEQEGGDPALRRSTLNQLNAMAEDPALCELIHSMSGWALVLQALCNALREDHCLDYPDAAIPAIGILTKLCFSVVTLRRFLGTNETAYHLIVRALLSFHQMPVFRVECCALLYLLLFADCSTGAGVLVSLPALCRSSAFRVPFVCHFHWEQSPFRQETLLEAFMDGPMIGSGTVDCSGVGGADTTGSILRMDERRRPVPAQKDLAANVAPLSTVDASSTYCEYLMRFIRFAFADVWFGGVDKILKATRRYSNTKSTSGAVGATDDENNLAPIEYGGRVAGTPAFRFNSALRLTKQDVRWLKMVDTASTLRKAMRRIGAAKSPTDVYAGLATMEANMCFPLNTTQCFPEQQLIIDTLQRYLVAPPATAADQKLLVAVLSTTGNLITFGQHKIRDWVIDTLTRDGLPGSVFLQLLCSDTTGDDLYANTVRFLRVVLLSLTSAYFQESPDREAAWSVWGGEMFRLLVAQLDREMQAAKFRRVYYLVTLVKLLADRIQWKELDVAQIVNKLFQYVRDLRPTHYNASSIVRSCLMSIRKLLSDEMVKLKPPHYKMLLMLGGHRCPLVRAYAWNVLARLARSADNVRTIIQDGSYLPGGIHACCVVTLLDPNEACLVRESTASFLTQLINHMLDKDGNARESMMPTATALSEDLSKGYMGPFAPIGALLFQQDFFTRTACSVSHYTPQEFFTSGRLCTIQSVIPPITTAELVKGYLQVYNSMLAMKQGMFAAGVVDKGCLKAMMDCVMKHPMDSPTHSQWLMVAALCPVLLRCVAREPDAVRMLTADLAFVRRLVGLLRPSEYCHIYTKVTEYAAKINIMLMLNSMPAMHLCKRFLRSVFAKANMKPVAQLIVEGITSQNEHMRLVCLDFVTIQAIDKCQYGHSPFLTNLDAVSMVTAEDDDDGDGDETRTSRASAGDSDDSADDGRNDDETSTADEDITPSSPSLVEQKEAQKTARATAELSGTGHIFKLLLDQFKRGHLALPSVEKPSLMRKLYTAIQILVRTSPKSRLVAWQYGLLPVVIECLNSIHAHELGGLSYAEFLRKHGEGKKGPYVMKLLELLRILQSWFGSRDEAIFLKQDDINALCRIMLLYWSWMSASNALELLMLDVLALLSGDSIHVCKTMATTLPGFPHSIQKLLIVNVTAETARVKGPATDPTALAISLRVLMNCCCCQEGRSMIGKLHVLDNISKLHPSVTKMHKPWPDVTRMWLEFWEYYSQFEEGSEVKHLTVLGALVRRSDLHMRHNALSIIRNLTFVAANRAALLASSDYMFMLQNALSRTAIESEQLLAAVTVWKMIANNHKGRAAIKASPLVRHVADLVKWHSVVAHPDNELFTVLTTVSRILKS